MRREREAHQLSLDQMAERTKIGVRYLMAIEAGDLESLPGGFFRRSFIRQYAEALGIDTDSVDGDLDRYVGSVDQLRALPPLTGAQTEYIVEPIPTGAAAPRRSHAVGVSIALLVLALIACTTVYALWEKTTQTPAHLVP